MEKLFSATAFLCFGMVGSALAQDIDLTIELCAQENVQSSCQASCAIACNDTSFLSANTSYCLENGLIGVEISPQPDSAQCIGIFQPEAEKPEVVVDANSPTANSDQCAQFETYSERRRCELEAKQLTPQCARTPVELEGRARLMVTEIGLELDQFGDLLESDWTDINNRDALCSFSIAELDENYQIASENPDLLRALQRQATNIQSCQSDWENWMRDNAGNQGSGTLIDQVTRDAEAQLGPLKTEIANLRVSVETLESATDTIGDVIDVHIFYCDPAGTQPAQGE